MPNYNNHALFANGAGNRISIQVIEMNLYYRCTPCTRKALKLRPHILGIAPSMEGTLWRRVYLVQSGETVDYSSVDRAAR